ncbi:MAG: lipoyl(octanoyl) transferase LipB [Chloroflexi bacterium]|nr:lipoyl(octanoyl) transferase LipB [Chloroflexota bacterium]
MTSVPTENSIAPSAQSEPQRRPCRLIELGSIDYLRAWQLQKQLAEARYEDAIDDLLLLLEHPHTYTTGPAGKDTHILFDDATLRMEGATFYRVDRGGDITYHGPGQLVGYPIFDLRCWTRDLHRYLRTLEEVLIRTLLDFGVVAERIKGATGVWVNDAKIAAIGVKVTRWIAFHGFALNVSTDLSYFANIVPCGLSGKGVTSLARVMGENVTSGEVVRRLAAHFSDEFGVRIIPSSLDQIASVIDQKSREQV